MIKKFLWKNLGMKQQWHMIIRDLCSVMLKSGNKVKSVKSFFTLQSSCNGGGFIPKTPAFLGQSSLWKPNNGKMWILRNNCFSPKLESEER